MKRTESIIYVNYSPYENSGKILDYLLENFEYVFLISLGFYYLGKKHQSNSLIIHKNGRFIRKYSSYQIPFPPKLVFLFIPIRSFINLGQIIFWSIALHRQYGIIDYFFSVNAFTAWTGNIVRLLGIAKKTIFWVWDYYPPVHESKIITLMRAIYWQFDKWAMDSNKLVFVNRRLLNLRKAMGLIAHDAIYPIIPIGTENIVRSVTKNKNHELVFGFIGVLKKSHGLGIVFDNSKKILSQFQNVRYEIIGSGPDEEYFKVRAHRSLLSTTFYGYVEDGLFNNILSHCTIGIATYMPDSSNVSYYGDPGKIKRYISLGIPVIATDVVEFSDELKKSGAGEIIDYHEPTAFLRAIQKILSNYDTYVYHAMKLSQKYNYRKIYPYFFVS